MSDRPGNWLALARRVGLVYAAAAGVGSAAVVGLLVSVRRRTRGNALQLFGPLATLHTIASAILTKHVRNMLLSSGAFAVLARLLIRRVMWLPRWMRKGIFGNFAFFFVCIWTLFYRLKVIELPRPSYQRTVWNMAIMERFHVRPFYPVWWAFNTHTQTVLCNGLNCLDDQLQPFSKYERELLPAFDGNSVVLDWASEGSDLGPASPIVVVLHGILGSAEENYCRNVVKLCLKRGWRPVVNFRWRIDFGENRDVEVIVDTLHKRYPRAPIVAIAYSAGAHVLLTYLQRKKKDTPLVGSVVVSAGFDLVKMMKYSETPGNKPYHMALSSAVRQCILRHVEWDKNLEPAVTKTFLQRMSAMGAHEMYDNFLTLLPTFSGKLDLRVNSSMAEFAPAPEGPLSDTDRVAALQHDSQPLTQDEYSPFGNPTASHYRFTAGNNMDKVSIPCLVLHSRDDPVCAPAFCPMLAETASTNRNVIVLLTNRGGHSGWHQGAYPTGPSWAEFTAVDYLAGLLAAQAQTAFMLDIVRRSLAHELGMLRAAVADGGAGTGAGAGAVADRDGTASQPPAVWQQGGVFGRLPGVDEGETLGGGTGGGDDGRHQWLRASTARNGDPERQPYSPPVISRICSASDLAYPNQNLLSTPPPPVVYSPLRQPPPLQLGSGPSRGVGTRSQQPRGPRSQDNPAAPGTLLGGR